MVLLALHLVIALGASLHAPSTAPQPPAKPAAGTTPAGMAAPTMRKLPRTTKVPVTFDALFAARDSRAVAALEYLRCMQGTADALRSGQLGAVPTAWSITCVKQAGEWRGVFGDLIDSPPGIRVHLQYAFRGNGMRVTDRIDTARVSGTARALLRGLATPLARDRTTQFVPIVLWQGNFVEVWLLPLPGNPIRAVTGGDSLIQMSQDGSRELGHSRSTPPVRTFTIEPAGATYTLESREERIPLLSELVIAHMALGLVPEVRVRARQYESVLSRATGGWKHTQR